VATTRSAFDGRDRRAQLDHLLDTDPIRQHQRLGAAVSAGGEQFEARRRSGLGPRRRRKSVVGMVSCAYSRSAPMTQDKITIYGPKGDGTYVVEFKTAAGETLAISVPSGGTAVLQHFQARMPYGLVVPETDRPPDDG
jgi:hypothetical protein